MRSPPILTLVLFFTVASAFVQRSTFRQLNPGGYNFTVDQSVYGVERPAPKIKSRVDENLAEKERWDKAVCKGAELLDAMNSDEKRAGNWLDPPRDSADSPYTTFSDLVKWGYEDAAWDNYYDLDVSLPIKKALSGLNLDTKVMSEGGKNRCMQLEHEHEVTVDGTTYKPTTAYFTNVFNVQEGLLVGWAAYGASYQGLKQNPPITVLPKLRNWSDIVFLQWKRMAGDHLKNLRYVIKTPVANTESLWIIEKAFKKSQKQLSTWPGVEFDMESDEGKAILSGPNGAGIAYLLFTHKKELGQKTISKITVFADDGKKQPRPPSLVWHVTGDMNPPPVNDPNNYEDPDLVVDPPFYDDEIKPGKFRKPMNYLRV